MVDPDELASSAHVIHVLKIILTGGAWPGGRSKIKEGTTTATRISWYILRTSDIPLLRLAVADCISYDCGV